MGRQRVAIGHVPAESFGGRNYGGIFGTLMVTAISGAAAGPWPALRTVGPAAIPPPGCSRLV
jgi:hypothetical protein